MASINIPADLDSQLDQTARETGRPKEEVVREAIVRYLEDAADFAIAQESLREAGPRVSLEELEREFGMGD